MSKSKSAHPTIVRCEAQTFTVSDDSEQSTMRIEMAPEEDVLEIELYERISNVRLAKVRLNRDRAKDLVLAIKEQMKIGSWKL